MAHATARFVTPRYGRAFAQADHCRNKGRTGIGLGAVVASCGFGLAGVTALCVVAIAISGNGATQAGGSSKDRVPVALLDPRPILAGTFSGSALAAGPAYVRHFVAEGGERTQVVALTSAAALAPALTALLPLPPRRPHVSTNLAQLPRARPASASPVQADEFTTASIGRAAERAAVDVATKPSTVSAKRVASLEPQKPPAAPEPDRRTAVYDIAAATVYMPNGQKLEAHSGLGHRRDDPQYIKQRKRGPTPPNVYDLSLRERLFHGVRAIRLNPQDEDKMYGRDGMLAHTYMLGNSGQSFGCVSFKNYNAFLQAYLKGEVDRLIVVAHSDAPPASIVRAHPRAADRLALNSQ